MKLVVKHHKIFVRYLALLASVLTLASCQSVSEKAPVAGSNIHTVIHKETLTLSPIEYRKAKHTLFLVDRSNKDSKLTLLAAMMESQGFRITTNKGSADYIMRITSFVTMPGKAEGSAAPYLSEYLLSMKDSLPVLKPLLINSGDTTSEQIQSMAKLVRQSDQGILSSADTSNVVTAGSTFGFVGGLIAGATSSVVDAAAGIVSKTSIREGLAGFNFSVIHNGGFLNTVYGLNVYAASSAPEKPDVLLRAAIERVSLEIEKL